MAKLRDQLERLQDATQGRNVILVLQNTGRGFYDGENDFTTANDAILAHTYKGEIISHVVIDQGKA